MRALVPFENIQTELSLNSEDRVWTYVLEKQILPSLDFPIAQSYVDTVIIGCLNFSEKMARDLIKSTFAWEYAWIDDRTDERKEMHSQVDSLLIQELGEDFQNKGK